MSSIQFKLNNHPVAVNVDGQTPLLWVLRDTLGLTGTKYGCGVLQCGACTVHIDDEPTRSCQLAIETVAGKRVTTIEGLAEHRSHPIQQAWIAEQVPQCGYCQSGQIMAAAALLAKNPSPSDRDIELAMRGNLCRCGTYRRIRRAIRRAASASGAAASPTAQNRGQ
ncbi:MAG: (2Fe-2S)-binding protein [Proteobacteria bacterium]|nr:(2Fe-2S)-binding protein [Pseudomonadota bacterium]